MRTILLAILLALLPSVAWAVLTDNLAVYYRLDEASGNALDALGSVTLTETGGTIGSVAGKLSTARDFEAGDTEYFGLADNAALSTGDIDFTFSAWVNAETLASFPVVLSKHGTGVTEHEYAIYIDTTSSTKPAFVVTTAASVQATAQWGSAITTSSWVHIVAWHDAANDQIGITINNGTPVITAHAGGVRDGTQPFQIGAASISGLYWDGLIDEAAFWKRVLTADERTALYNSGNGYDFLPRKVIVHYDDIYLIPGAPRGVFE